MKSLVLAVIGLLCSMSVRAHDFEVDGIYYNITSADDKTVEVTYKGAAIYEVEYSGSVTIPETVTYNEHTYSVTEIAFCAFQYCSGLTSVKIPNSVTNIWYSAFDGCSSLTSVTIPNSVTNIESHAFARCSSLTSVDIPNSVTYIGSYAFLECSSLTSVVIPNSVTGLGIRAFSDCSSLTSITVAEDNPTFDSRDNCNAIIETQTNTLIAGCSKTTILNSVTSIGDYAFSDCSSLTSVEIPNSVTTIGQYAFECCSNLTSVTIPNSVTHIGYYAFSECSNLTSITSYISANKLFVIDGDVFQGIDKTNCTLYVPYGAQDMYAATSGWSDFTNIVEIHVPYFDLTVSSAGYATLYLGGNYEIPDGVEVYTAREIDGDRLMMELVEDVLPANTGVVVKAPAGTYTFTYTATDVPAIPNNLFKGTVVNEYINVPSNSTAFVLSKVVNGEVGMYPAKLTDGRFLNNANKAYLLLANNKLGLSDEELDTSVGGAQLSLRFDFGDTTGVDEVQTETGVNNAIYDMYGRKVNTITTPGLYIVNGKKVWVK